MNDQKKPPSADVYTIDGHGERGGLVGHYRVLRNGEPVRYFEHVYQADEWIAAVSGASSHGADLGAK